MWDIHKCKMKYYSVNLVTEFFKIKWENDITIQLKEIPTFRVVKVTHRHTQNLIQSRTKRQLIKLKGLIMKNVDPFERDSGELFVTTYFHTFILVD